MKKRLLSLLLTAVMVFPLFCATANAADVAAANFSENNVTWIGTQAEYQKTIDNMFVDGMRKMLAGGKWGILDATGEWVAAPIYDSIELEYLVARSAIFDRPLTESSEPLEALFLDGYTQCVRGGKMGLMNRYGEEVIPCKYDGVGLPSEGICRIIKKTGSASYLGYWSLELGRELVAPNKYVVSGTAATATGRLVVHEMLDKNLIMSGVGGSSNPGAGSATVDYQEVTLPNGDRLAAEHDYIGGYAFVITGAGAPGCLYGTILDKSGKEILPGGPYLYRAGLYPQFGPYMVYCKQSDKPYYADGESLGKPYLTGVVGPKGVIIPAQYTGGIRAPIEGWYVGDARMSVIPELKLVITSKDTKPGKENGGKVGVVNFKNQTVIPFIHDFNYFTYNPAHKIFVGSTPSGDWLYTATGKRLTNSNYSEVGPYGNYNDAMYNGFAQIKKFTETTVNGNYQATHTKGFVNLKTGAEIFPDMSNAQSATSSVFSTTGLVWVMNEQKKWALIDGRGKIILPYQYDAVAAVTWHQPKNGYAIVNIGHKQGIVTTAGVQLVPCEYEKLAVPAAHGPIHKEYVEATKDGKTGLLSAITGKIVMPCSFADIGGFNSFLYQSEYFNLGVNVVKTGDEGYCLVNRDGSKVPGSDYRYIDCPNRGLFYTHKNGYIGAEGKVIFPDTLFYSGRKNLVVNDTTLVVKDGQVGYINSDKLAKPTQPKTAAPRSATAAPSPINLLVNGKATAAEAYGICGNNYIKVRDMACFLNGTDKNFSVAWNSARNAVELQSNTPYTAVAGDMAKGSATAKPAIRSTNAIYVDGLQRKLTAYAIGGNNFFKLRDVMRVFDVYVGYESGTVTVDSSRPYERTDAEKEGLIPAVTETDAPPAAQINKLEIRKSPNLEFYMTGNHTFSTEGFELRYWDEEGVPHAVTDTSLMEFKVEGKVIEDGYVFTVSSMKTGTVGYNGLTAPLRFPVYRGVTEAEIDREEGQTDQGIAEGNYTLSIFGKSIGMSNGWMIIDSKKPVTFGVERDGDGYYLFIDGVTRNSYIGTDYMNGQLKTSGKQKWRITHLGGDTYSVRQDNKPEMVVNAAGQQSKDGTKVIIYKHTGTPQNAIITFTPAQ